MKPLKDAEALELVRLHAVEEVWTSIDHLTNAIEDCFEAGKYETARNLSIVVAALWEVVKPVPEG